MSWMRTNSLPPAAPMPNIPTALSSVCESATRRAALSEFPGCGSGDPGLPELHYKKDAAVRQPVERGNVDDVEKGQSMGSRVTLEVPEDVSEEARKKALEAAVLALWEEGALSTGVAAAELDLTRHDFLDLLTARGIPVVRRPPNLE